MSERVWERRARTRTATRNPVPPENAQPAHRRGAPPPVLPALPPQDRPAGSPRPCVTAPARGEMPSFRRFQKRAICSCPEEGGRYRGLHALLPQLSAPFLPATFVLGSLSEVARPADSPQHPQSRRPHAPGFLLRSPRLAPAPVAVEFPQPIAPLAGGAALEASGRRSWGRRRRRRAVRPEREADQRTRWRGALAGRPSRRPRAPARARRKPPSTLALARLRDPPDPPVTSATTAPANPQPPTGSLARHW